MRAVGVAGIQQNKEENQSPGLLDQQARTWTIRLGGSEFEAGSPDFTVLF